ncbi:hypothetical protein E4P40_07595 [Blastococcus sp. CT_GayMR20]|uniref:hypothetical protein n=1 Tax=Blastococcus sp. CT_GayMR20 TaxID=2559609 RepID=UPI0010748CA9|nr:hypothetical protein [Blastococcus sp. CT_GayMR20]TFV90188.1 hypothetical protein E4P40_07490 [Blastococcus sp. CT_GayMR20]TFV90207.1 hypothetical protein E4P40_07595 [Blastococcus sp. CT_GayMR20]
MNPPPATATTGLLALGAGLLGVILGAAFQHQRDRAAHQRLLRTRWDETLLLSLVEYLGAVDKAVRGLRRAWELRAQGSPDAEHIKEKALECLEVAHEKSHAVTLLTGDADDAVRAAAREMRRLLLPVGRALRDSRELDESTLGTLVGQCHDARYMLIDAAQRRLGVQAQNSGRWSSATSAPPTREPSPLSSNEAR